MNRRIETTDDDIDPKVRETFRQFRTERGQVQDATPARQPSTEQGPELLTELTPYLNDLIARAPRFGSIGVTLTLHEGKIVRVESSMSEQRKLGAGV